MLEMFTLSQTIALLLFTVDVHHSAYVVTL